MRFRLGINGFAGSQPAADSFGRGFQSLAMLPMLKAQAADEYQKAETEAALRSAQQRQADAHAALFEQEAQAKRDQLARGGLGETLVTAALMNKLPLPQANEFRDYAQTGQLAPLYNEPGDGVGPSVPKPAYADPSGLGGQIMQTLGLLRGGQTVGGNIDQVAKAGGELQQQDATAGVMSGKLDPTRVAQAFYGAKGGTPFNFHEFGTGNNLTGAVDDTAGPAARFSNLRTQETATQRSLELEHQAQGRAADALAKQRQDNPGGMGRGGGGAGAGPANPDALLSNEDATFMAQQYLRGDQSVMTNLGRGAQGAQNIIKLRRAIRMEAEAAGLSPAQVATALAQFQGDKAAFRAAGTKGANVEMAAAEADQVADLALQASAAVPRTQFVPVNRALQAYRTNTGDPRVVQFGAATNALINTYARAISPSGTPTVHDKQHAEDILSTAQTPDQYAAVVTMMKREISAAKASPGLVRQNMRNRMDGGPGDPREATDPIGIGRAPIASPQIPGAPSAPRPAALPDPLGLRR